MNATTSPSRAPRSARSARARSARTGRSARRTAAQRWSARLAFWSIVLLVALGIVPQIVVAVIGLVRGDVPPGGVLAASETYPAFQPPFWLLWIPALLMLGSALISIRETKPRGFLLWPARWELSLVAFVGAMITLGAAVAYDAPQFAVVMWAIVPWLLAILVFAVRGAVDLGREAWQLWGPGAR